MTDIKQKLAQDLIDGGFVDNYPVLAYRAVNLVWTAARKVSPGTSCRQCLEVELNMARINGHPICNRCLSGQHAHLLDALKELQLETSKLESPYLDLERASLEAASLIEAIEADLEPDTDLDSVAERGTQ